MTDPRGNVHILGTAKPASLSARANLFTSKTQIARSVWRRYEPAPDQVAYWDSGVAGVLVSSTRATIVSAAVTMSAMPTAAG